MPGSSTSCVDASLVVPFISAASPEYVVGLWSSWRAERTSLVAPYLLRYEVVNAMRRGMVAGTVDLPTARLGVRSLLALPIEFAHTGSMHARALVLASCFDLPTTYDAHYLALAEELDCEFWTADKRLARATNGAFPLLHLLEG